MVAHLHAPRKCVVRARGEAQLSKRDRIGAPRLRANAGTVPGAQQILTLRLAGIGNATTWRAVRRTCRSAVWLDAGPKRFAPSSWASRRKESRTLNRTCLLYTS